MKATKILLVATALSNFWISSAQAQQTWKLQPVQLQSRWAKDVSPSNALKEYPRPQMVRAGWTNLNGLWHYAITGNGAAKPSAWEGQILVPYPIESALSGVKKTLSPSQNLWYKRSFVEPRSRTKSGMTTTEDRVILNFGAVDYEATVFVNGTQVGHHEGGYTEFSFDITAALKSGENELVVKVFDPSGEGFGPHGKQVLSPQNIYYTSTSGIWQTVWMEVVPAAHIEGLEMTPDIDKGVLNLVVKGKGKAKVTVPGCSECEILKQVQDDAGSKITVKVPNAKLWSPGNPFLYDLEVSLGADKVKSYFGMRKISVAKDAAGVDRIMLNNKPYFNLGTLDQGFWPEGLYTAPTDEALVWDIKAIKAMGFNTIRKHIKVEPARWYYHADKIGMLIWQDCVNPNQGLPEGAKEAFEKGAAEMVKQLHNYPSIVTYVLFNEKWGQYDQERLTSWLKKADPSRIVNGHSGEYLYVNEQLRSPSPNAYINADMTDVHAYPDPMNSLAMPGKARVCGEFGGIGVFIPEHQWNTGAAWGYINEKPAGFKAKYTVMNQHLKLMEAEGLCGSIYTQPFDVEGEQNGIMTYDREVVKIPFAELRKIHSQLNPEIASPNWLAMTGEVVAKDADLTEPGQLYADAIAAYQAGKNDAATLKRLLMLAGQNNDLTGKARFGAGYLATLKAPFSDEDIQFVAQYAKSTNDAGFKLMVANEAAFKKAMGERQYTVAMMNMIFKGDIEPMVQDPTSINWDAIEVKVKVYGAAGEEMLLRAKTVHFLNAKDWSNYIPAATKYLEKYSAFIADNEKQLFRQQIDQNKTGTTATPASEVPSQNSAASVQDIKALDDKIKAEMVDPAVNKAKESDATPDWVAIDKAIAKKYDAKTADRNVTRAKLFFYYSKDWKQFATAIVNFTEKYEDKTNLQTLNMNAGFVLQHSTDKAELAKAQDWAKLLVEKEPNNEEYKATLAALTEKVQ